jgi:DNA-directed RNA polymerase specialized sigma24 family protein
MPKIKKAASKAAAPRTEPLAAEEKIARMLGILAVQNVRGKVEQVVLLRSGGFSIPEIAEMLDLPQNTVSVRLYTAKQKGQKGRANDDD